MSRSRSEVDMKQYRNQVSQLKNKTITVISVITAELKSEQRLLAIH